MIKDFYFSGQIEYRDDDTNYTYYGIIYKQQGYCISYYQNSLKEIYIFHDKEEYFIGYRVDTKQISYYYIHRDDNVIFINKYENNILKCVYYENKNITGAYKNGKKVTYTQHYKKINNFEQLYNDFVTFIDKINFINKIPVPKEPNITHS